VIEAVGWGALAASSLLVGALFGIARDWSQQAVGIVLGFGAGALVSAVSFELALDGLREGGLGSTAIGLAAGSLAYFAFDAAVERWLERRAQAEATPAASLALGAFLDSFPSNLVLGIGLARGHGVSVALLMAIFVSDLPEALGSARELEDAGRDRGTILRLWLAVAAVLAVATPAGRALAQAVADDYLAALNGFAAGALLVMLVTHMAPQAEKRAGRLAGLMTTMGFAAATALATVS
jgi:ZIP family zinc transporter